jgi:hypothetical protein
MKGRADSFFWAGILLIACAALYPHGWAEKFFLTLGLLCIAIAFYIRSRP